MKYLLLTTEHIEAIAEESPKETPAKQDEIVSMAMEVLEYRRAYGPLGCTYLEK